MTKKKKVLFIINTLGRGGAETAFLEFVKLFDPQYWKTYLYVIMEQGELIGQLPKTMILLNKRYDRSDVFSEEGKKKIRSFAVKRIFRKGAVFKNLPFILYHARDMGKEARHHPEKLLWQAIVDGTDALPGKYDLGIAYLEGASTYFLDRKVKAEKKIAFVHTDYLCSGYTREMDRSAYESMEKIFCVSDATRTAFVQVYQEYSGKTEVLYNILNREGILRKSAEACSFDHDGYTGTRIVTLGRLVKAKAVEQAIRTMRILKDAGEDARWYVFGEGSSRAFLENEIKDLGVEDCFFLPGMTENPFPYLKKADIYVQCSRVEGRSLAICEAQLLGCPVVISATSGNADHIKDHEDGILSELSPEAMAEAIRELIDDPALRQKLGKNAAQKMKEECSRQHRDILLDLLGE